MWLEHGLRGWPLLLKYSLISCKELYLMVHAHRQFQTRASPVIAWVKLCLLLTTILSCGTMGQSPPTVKTTDQSKARWLGGGTGFFSTHNPTMCTARVACQGNLAALKPPLYMLKVYYFSELVTVSQLESVHLHHHILATVAMLSF